MKSSLECDNESIRRKKKCKKKEGKISSELDNTNIDQVIEYRKTKRVREEEKRQET